MDLSGQLFVQDRVWCKCIDLIRTGPKSKIHHPIFAGRRRQTSQGTALPHENQDPRVEAKHSRQHHSSEHWTASFLIDRLWAQSSGSKSEATEWIIGSLGASRLHGDLKRTRKQALPASAWSGIQAKQREKRRKRKWEEGDDWNAYERRL